MIRRIVDYGRSAVLIELEADVEPAAVVTALSAAGIGDERLSGWNSVVVTGSSPQLLRAQIASVRQAIEQPPEASCRHVRVPFRADGADLEEVALAVGATPADVIEWFTSPEYRVVCLGFVRGFAYLAGLDDRLAVLGRRPTPRVAVPAGSVAFAGGQAGIYPTSSPGGWHLIGTTDLDVFDVDRDVPTLFAAGDRVRFEVLS